MTDQDAPTHPSETGHLTPEQLDELAVADATEDTRGTVDTGSTGVTGSTAEDLRATGPDAGHRHLATCVRCRAALAEQIAVRRVLQRVPDPGPMPADVVARLDNALANAASSASAAAPATVVPLHTPQRRSGVLGRLAESRVTKSLVAAAAIGLIGVGGYTAINRNQHGGGTTASSAGGAQAREPKAAPGLASVRAQESGSAYTKANIVGLLTQRLSAQPASGAGDSSGGGPLFATEGEPLATAAGLQACLQALDTPTAVPQLVDLATFEGKPAAILVLPGSAGGREVWVVSRTCSPGHDGTLFFALIK